MIFHAANNDGLAFEVGEDAAKIAMQFVAQRFVTEEGPPVFGREDRMNQDSGERLRHVGMVWKGVD